MESRRATGVGATLLPLALLAMCGTAALVDCILLSVTSPELVIDVKKSLNLTCSGSDPVSWASPRNESFVAAPCPHRGRQGFCATLHVPKAAVEDTGRYRCFYSKYAPYIEGLDNSDHSASVYVFVRDYSRPFLQMSREGVDVVYLFKGSPYVVPCRVSAPDMNVTFVSFIPSKRYQPNNKDLLWDPKVGFTVMPGLNTELPAQYFCEVNIRERVYLSDRFMPQIVVKDAILNIGPNTTTELMVGETLLLNCSITTKFNVVLEMKWLHVDRPNHPLEENCKSFVDIMNDKGKQFTRQLELRNVTVSDAGNYLCSVSYMQEHCSSLSHVIIYERPFISAAPFDGPLVEVEVGKDVVTLQARISAYPLPKFNWFKDGVPIVRGQPRYRIFKFEKRQSEWFLMLIVQEVTDADAGSYTLQLELRQHNLLKRVSFTLVVNVPSEIHEKIVAAESDVTFPLNSQQSVVCTAYGLPPPAIHWYWQPCDDNARRCYPRKQNWVVLPSHFHVINGPNRVTINTRMKIFNGKNKTVSSLLIGQANMSGHYRCEAVNDLKADQWTVPFFVTDVPGGLEARLSADSSAIEGDNLTLECRANKFLYGNVGWLCPSVGSPAPAPSPFPPLDGSGWNLPAAAPVGAAESAGCAYARAAEATDGTYSTLARLSIPGALRAHAGNYACLAQSRSGRWHRRNVTVELQAQEPVNLRNLSAMALNVSDSLRLECSASGRPRPTITWFKDGRPLTPGTAVRLSESGSVLSIDRVKEEDSGVYMCYASNRLGEKSTSTIVSVHGLSDQSNMTIILLCTGVIGILLWLLLILFIRRVRQPSSADIKTGYLSIIMDPGEVPLDEQCQRLPYDASKWEFPRDRLKLGKTLGRGAFGRVMEAAAFGIDKSSTCRTVAVKMLKEGATTSEYHALMSELKILIHIGNHLNVVNLLGACTKPGGPLMVVVEYCKYGNLSNYLRNKRQDFVIDKERPGKTRGDRADARENGDEKTRRLDSVASSRSSNSSGFAEDKTLRECEADEEFDETCKRPLTMKDLICYSFQVARGMEFLSSRKCIHRDLAARNILLSDNNVVKICDFGLARDIYKDPDYVRKGDARLPLKWMAPESIFDKLYTTQSDVWSFGVLLWEIFSLGASPYPGVQIDEDFCRRLKDGTRMRPPEYSTPDTYQIMLDSWCGDALDRPTFSELVERLGDLLQASVQQGGKDYLVALDDESGFSLLTTPGPCAADDPHDPNFNYDNVATFRYSSSGRKSARPVSVKTFDEVPLEKTTPVSREENQTDSGMILASEEFKRLEVGSRSSAAFGVKNASSKSKESLLSEGPGRSAEEAQQHHHHHHRRRRLLENEPGDEQQGENLFSHEDLGRVLQATEPRHSIGRRANSSPPPAYGASVRYTVSPV
uniref:receptor protein-tyrosine kinase n=1 Tax=Petromyzon marinus TaxID=7757 RepID=A0AAJ7WXK5_PETMA|nr:vascular endothelial growth factor receptor 1 isoform X1 [Petromyzon marinus]